MTQLSIIPAAYMPPLLLSLLLVASSAVATTTPYKISFSSLESAIATATTNKAVSPPRLLLEGLLTTNPNNNGLISITDLPNNFEQEKLALFSNLHACLISIEEEDGGTTTNLVPTEHLADGTIRRSFATLTQPNEKIGAPIQSLEQFLEANTKTNAAASCFAFQNHLDSFRSTVSMVTTKFAQQLSFELEPYLAKPLLHSATTTASTSHSSDEDSEKDYQDFAQTVAGGDHLEHFHSYQRTKKTTTNQNDDSKTTTTIELHTDQGLFIAFTPGLLLPAASGVAGEGDVIGHPSLLAPSKGLVIQDSDGKNHVVEFTNEDDLVFMMGDGVNQVINGQLSLVITPHALVLDTHDENVLARVWYGRMVLPPNDAYSPALPNYTFGKLRQSLVHSSTHGEGVVPSGIGCSSPTLQTVIAATSRRSLSEEGGAHDTTCAQDELFCWFGCMSLPEYNISSELSCTERNLSLECMNPRGQVHLNGEEHGDFFPACTNRTYETHPVTPYPTINQQDESVCTSDLWTEFLMEESYDHKATLTRPNGTETILLWSIVDNGDSSKKLKARLVFDNVFGWLAIGFANHTDVGVNGMLGANILLAMPGGNYDAATGMDLSVDGTVATYKIDEEETAFRHWQTPIDNDETQTTVAGFEDTDCFTALTFESDHINGQKFTLDGTDEMIWAGNHNDIWMSYHGPFDRARFAIDWNKDEGVVFSRGETESETTEPATVEVGVASGGCRIMVPLTMLVLLLIGT